MNPRKNPPGLKQAPNRELVFAVGRDLDDVTVFDRTGGRGPLVLMDAGDVLYISRHPKACMGFLGGKWSKNYS
ncbi:hypothetical protein CTA1_10216 [Colletotrichum tanaceti]|uniref:Uncharacterized protein n=1 Tax=Colletotrichum tanaceti TaxID=1306861 RepID=A0A4U6XUA1_9PEZI|nr:hypothetical protein CTA1_10216 [Colletotrichum tanaceti]